ncbi:MAG: amidohydrolase family protein [Vicinamibacterales bacterium]
MRMRLLLVLVPLVGGASQPSVQQISGPTEEYATAFVDVTVVPMDGERLVPHQTVVVRGTRIADIGPAVRLHVPQEAQRIDGRGKYLMPGLADMHSHPERLVDLLVYVASGVTTVRTMGSPPDLRHWRAESAANRLVSPAIYTAGPVLDGPSEIYQGGPSVETAAAAVQAVREQHDAGFDFIKVYNNLSKEGYEAVVAEARRLGMPVAGHVPFSVGLKGALAARQASIEHLRGYAAELVRADAPLQAGNDFRTRTLDWNYADETRFSSLAEATRAAGVWNCPTLVWNQTQLLPSDEYARWLARPELSLAWPDLLADGRSRWPYMKNFTDADYVAAQRGIPVQQRFVKALKDAGARLLLGTDLGAFAVTDELTLLAESGLSPYEALRTGTRDAAEFLGQTEEWGTVSAGLRADLLLLDANPLADVANTKRRVGIMLRGRWLPNAEMARLIYELTTGVESGKP